MDSTGNGTRRRLELEQISPDEGRRDVRREGKRQRKHERDQVRRINGWEQYRTLWDGIDFKRQIINMGDKKSQR